MAFLNKPFPIAELSKRSLIANFFVGCFVALFLIVFEPFGISEWRDDKKIIKLAGFGLISFIIPLIVGSMIATIIQKKSIEDKWTIGKEITAILIILLCIAFGNLFYGRALHIMPVTFKGFLFAFVSVLLIGIFPVALHVIRKHNKLLKTNLEKAILVNKHLQNERVENQKVPKEDPVPNMPDNIADETKVVEAEIKNTNALIFIAENEKDRLELIPDQLLYIESADNYSNIVFIENQKIKKQLIRSSLKRIESQVKLDFIVRCHRTFIINLKNVKKVEGNAAGYKLSFDIENYSVPVSRNYGNQVIEKLKDLK